MRYGGDNQASHYCAARELRAGSIAVDATCVYCRGLPGDGSHEHTKMKSGLGSRNERQEYFDRVGNAMLGGGVKLTSVASVVAGGRGGRREIHDDNVG